MKKVDNMIKLSSKNYVFGGVCGGLAEHFDIDVFLCRGMAVFLFFVEPLAVLLSYFILYLVLPKQNLPNKTTKEAINSMNNGRYNEYSSVDEMKKEIIGK